MNCITYQLTNYMAPFYGNDDKIPDLISEEDPSEFTDAPLVPAQHFDSSDVKAHDEVTVYIIISVWVTNQLR